MSSAYIVKKSDDNGEEVTTVYEAFEINEALVDFLQATINCEAATLVWSS